jgi:hypothetical protein
MRKFHFTNSTKEDILEDFEDYFEKENIEYEVEYIKDDRYICLTIGDE